MRDEGLSEGQGNEVGETKVRKVEREKERWKSRQAAPEGVGGEEGGRCWEIGDKRETTLAHEAGATCHQ